MATIVAEAALGGPLTTYSSERWGWRLWRGIDFFLGTLSWCECQLYCGGKGAGYVVVMQSDSDKGYNIICEPDSISAFLLNYVSLKASILLVHIHRLSFREFDNSWDIPVILEDS